MKKLYICYLILGAYFLFNSFFIWEFRSFNDGNSILTYSALLFSFILFIVIPGLSLYRPRQAAILACITLIGYFPFGIRWLIYRYKYEWPLIEGGFNQIMLVVIVLYFVTLFYAARYIIKYKQTPTELSIKKIVKLIFTALPVFLIIVLYIMDSLIK